MLIVAILGLAGLSVFILCWVSFLVFQSAPGTGHGGERGDAVSHERQDGRE